jgi:hypothetical protein
MEEEAQGLQKESERRHATVADSVLAKLPKPIDQQTPAAKKACSF